MFVCMKRCVWPRPGLWTRAEEISPSERAEFESQFSYREKVLPVPGLDLAHFPSKISHDLSRVINHVIIHVRDSS